MKIKKYDLIPLLLFIYTIVMAVWGWNQFDPNLFLRFGRSCLIQKRFIYRERVKVKQVISGSIPMRMGIPT